jgi:hypothetical protein
MSDEPKHPYDQAHQPQALHPTQPADIVRFWVMRHIVALQAEIILLETSRTSDELLTRRIAAYVVRLKELIIQLEAPLNLPERPSGLRGI